MNNYKFEEEKISKPIIVNGKTVEAGKKAKASEKPIDIDALIREKRDGKKE